MQHQQEIGWEYRKAADKHWARMVFFATLLLISHLLKIEPSHIDAEGIKIAIEDVSVIRGGLALVFLYYAFSTLDSFVAGAVLSPPFSPQSHLMRRLIVNGRKPRLDSRSKRRELPLPRQVKRSARITIVFYQLAMAPFYLTITAILLVAGALAVYDTYRLVDYSIDKFIAEQDAAWERERDAMDRELDEAILNATNAVENATKAVERLNDETGQ